MPAVAYSSPPTNERENLQHDSRADERDSSRDCFSKPRRSATRNRMNRKIIATIVFPTLALALSLSAPQTGVVLAGETLYNGIELPDQWPPNKSVTREPMSVPYLRQPPAVIPIDVGRQLFVDDFLVESTTLKRTFHKAKYHPANPILTFDKPWEKMGGVANGIRL